MSKLYYFKDFSKRKFSSTSGKDITYDCNKLSLVERLVISAYITLLKNGIDASSLKNTERQQTLARTIYDYDGYQTPKNFEDFDEAVTNIFIEHVELLHFIKDNINSVKTAKKDKMMYVIQIDTEEIFLVKSIGKSICPIAWKAAALAASNSSYDNKNFKRLHYFNWSVDKVENESKDKIKNLKQNKANIINRINNWVDAVMKYRENKERIGNFDGDYFVVGKSNDNVTVKEKKKPIENKSSDVETKENELSDEEQRVSHILCREYNNKKPMSRSVAAYEVNKQTGEVVSEDDFRVDLIIERDAAKRGIDPKAVLPSFDQYCEENKHRFLKKEEEKTEQRNYDFQYDDNDDFNLYDGVDWESYYMHKKESVLKAYENGSAIWTALNNRIKKYFDIDAMLRKVAKNCEVSLDAVYMVRDGKYLDESAGGFVAKKKIIEGFKKIKKDVMIHYNDDSWQKIERRDGTVSEVFVGVLGRLLLGYMWTYQKGIMRVN